MRAPLFLAIPQWRILDFAVIAAIQGLSDGWKYVMIVVLKRSVIVKTPDARTYLFR